MANSIALFKQYVPLLDEVYKEASKTAVLDGNPELARAGANANELVIPMLDMQSASSFLLTDDTRPDSPSGHFAGSGNSSPCAARQRRSATPE